MLNSYTTAMRNYATFSGRAARSEYWQFVLVLAGMYIIATILDAAVSTPVSQSVFFVRIVHLAHLVPNLAITTRRLHDTGHSGWWIFVLPVAIFFLCQTGTPGDNSYDQPSRVPDNSGSEASSAAGHEYAEGASLTDQLERLSALRSNGSLSDSEYEVMKSRLLAKGT